MFLACQSTVCLPMWSTSDSNPPRELSNGRSPEARDRAYLPSRQSLGRPLEYLTTHDAALTGGKSYPRFRNVVPDDQIAGKGTKTGAPN